MFFGGARVNGDALEIGEVGIAIVAPAHGADKADAGFEGNGADLWRYETTGRGEKGGRRAGELLDSLLGDSHLFANFGIAEPIHAAMLVTVQTNGLLVAAHFPDGVIGQIPRPVQFGGGDKENCAAVVS